MSDTFTLQTQHSTYVVRPRVGWYGSGDKAIRLLSATDASPVAVATVYVPGANLEDDEVLIKDWSENVGVLMSMTKAGYVEPPHGQVPTGWVEADRCRLTPKGMKLFEDAIEETLEAP